MTLFKHALAASIALAMSLGAQAAVTLKLSHNQSKDLPVHKAMEFFGEKVAEYTNGEVKVRIYPNAQLGTQRESMELVQSGGLALAKTNASEIEAFEPLYAVFNQPFIFKDETHYYEVLGGDIGEEVLNASVDKGFIGITYYDAGSRSFYAGKPIKHPDDLKNMKLRVQPSPTAVKMVELLGAHPTPIAFGELYTALQQGVVDGAENNESALVDNRHGEVSKFYSYDQHTMAAIKKAGKESMMKQKELWAENTVKVIKEAKEKLGVTFVEDVDKAAFAEKVLPMHEEAAKASPKAAELIQRIKDAAKD